MADSPRLIAAVATLDSRVGSLDGRFADHDKQDREDFGVLREHLEVTKKEVHEVKLILAELGNVREELDAAVESVTKIQVSLAGQKPWLDLVKHLVYFALGIIATSLFYLLGLGNH